MTIDRRFTANDHTRLCFPVTFRQCSLYLLIRTYFCSRIFLLIAFCPTRTIHLCYTRISALHRKTGCLALPAVAITATAIVYWLILHRSVYCPAHKICDFDIHIHQYNDLDLKIFFSLSNFTVRCTTYSQVSLLRISPHTSFLSRLSSLLH